MRAMVDQPGFFDVSDRLRDLSAKGDDLERIAVMVDFAQFQPELERAVPRSDGSKGGRPAFGHVLMFKVLLLQAMHGLSDERCEYLIKDRLSFMRFLGLNLADPVPDANTIWSFREALKRAGAVDALFSCFEPPARNVDKHLFSATKQDGWLGWMTASDPCLPLSDVGAMLRSGRLSLGSGYIIDFGV
jgi:hypothetical protein